MVVGIFEREEMTKDDIIHIIQKASATNCGYELIGEAIERFAALVAAREREECARIFDSGGTWIYRSEAAANIRARGEKCTEN